MRRDPQSYDQLAEHFEQLSQLNAGSHPLSLEPLLPATRGHALDLGCGAGRHAATLARHFDHVTAVDVSAPMVELARGRRPAHNIDYQVANLLDVDGEYDFVLSVATLHHLTDLPGALRHVRSLVTSPGRAVLIDVLAPGRRSYRLFQRVAPRTFYRLGATLELRRRMRSGDSTARERYAIETYAPWLDHLATDRYLTRSQFETVYRGELPGAAFSWPPGRGVCIWDRR